MPETLQNSEIDKRVIDANNQCTEKHELSDADFLTVMTGIDEEINNKKTKIAEAVEKTLNYLSQDEKKDFVKQMNDEAQDMYADFGEEVMRDDNCAKVVRAKQALDDLSDLLNDIDFKSGFLDSLTTLRSTILDSGSDAELKLDAKLARLQTLIQSNLDNGYQIAIDQLNKLMPEIVGLGVDTSSVEQYVKAEAKQIEEKKGYLSWLKLPKITLFKGQQSQQATEEVAGSSFDKGKILDLCDDLKVDGEFVGPRLVTALAGNPPDKRGFDKAFNALPEDKRRQVVALIKDELLKKLDI